MRLFGLAIVIVLAATAALKALDDPPEKPKADAATPAERLRDLIAEHRAMQESLSKAFREAKTDDERLKILREGVPELQEFGGRVLELAEEHPKDPVALDALIWISTNMPSGPEAQKATDILLRDHVQSDKLGPICLQLTFGAGGPDAEELLREVAAKNPHREVKGQATFALASLIKNLTEYSPEFTERPAAEKEARLKEAEGLFDEVARDYANVEAMGQRLGDLAKGDLLELRELAIGKPAPEIEGSDADGKPMTLSEHRGQVVVLSFWGSWCGPCMSLVPHERELVGRLEGKPFAFLGINSDRDRDTLKDVMKTERITWRSWWDGGGTGGPIATAWNVKAWPTIYVLDPKGVIRYKHVRGPAMDKAVDALLSEMGEHPDAAKDAEG